MELSNKYEPKREQSKKIDRGQKVGNIPTLLREEIKQSLRVYAPLMEISRKRALEKIQAFQETSKQDRLAPLMGREDIALKPSLDLLQDMNFVLSVSKLCLSTFIERSISDKHKYKTLEAYNLSLNTLTRKGLASSLLKLDMDIDNPYFVKSVDNLLGNNLSNVLGGRNLSSSVYAYRYFSDIMDYDYEGQPVDDRELMASSTYVSHKASLQRKSIYNVLNSLYRLHLLNQMKIDGKILDENNRKIIKKLFENVGSKEISNLFNDYTPDDNIKQSHFGLYKTTKVELDWDDDENSLLVENGFQYANRKHLIDIHNYEDLQLSEYEIVEFAESMNFLMRNPPEINASSIHTNKYCRDMAVARHGVTKQESYKYVFDLTQEDWIRKNPEFKKTKKLMRDLEQTGPAIASKRATIYDIDRTELFYGTMHYPAHERAILATISLTGCRPSEIANGVLVQAFAEDNRDYLRFWIRGSKMKDPGKDLEGVVANTPLTKRIKKELSKSEVYQSKNDKGVPWKEVVVPVPVTAQEQEESPEAYWMKGLIDNGFKSPRLLDNERRITSLVEEFATGLLREGLPEDEFQKRVYDFQISLLKKSKLFDDVLASDILKERTQEIKYDIAWKIALDEYAGIDITSDNNESKFLFVTDNYSPHVATLNGTMDDIDFKKSNYVSRLVKRMIVSAYGANTAASAYTLRHLYSCDIRQKTLTGDLFIPYKEKKRDGLFADNFKLTENNIDDAIVKIEDSLIKRAEASGHRSTKTGHRYGVSNSSKNTRKNAVKSWGTHGKSNNIRLSNSSVKILKKGHSPSLPKFNPK